MRLDKKSFLVVLFPLSLTVFAQAIVKLNLDSDVKIMGKNSMEMQSFQDTVRDIQKGETMTRIIFRKHAAVYKIETKNLGSFLSLLEKSKKEKKPLKISVENETNKILDISF